MTRFSLLLSAILLVSMLSAQDCTNFNCISGNVYPLANFGYSCHVDVPATDFVLMDELDCSSTPEVAVYRYYETLFSDFVPDFQERDTIRFFENDDEATGLSVFLKNASGTIQSCEAYVLLQSVFCEPTESVFAINGQVLTEYNEPISNVVIRLSGGVVFEQTNNNDGYYSFIVPPVDSIHVLPERLDNPLNGVSTFDLILISKHILGLQPLNSPYRIIAADVNNSGSITVLDLIQIRKLILGLNTTFPNTPSWRFISPQYVFPEWMNPWYEVFPEAIDITDPSNFVEANFVGIKTGDVNGSAQSH